jgi:hypothetical protein
VQLADELEATREMVKADWKCWKKLEEQFSDLDEDDQDEARLDKMMRQRWNVACTRDGYVALLPLPPPNSMSLQHQELCSKKAEN